MQIIKLDHFFVRLLIISVNKGCVTIKQIEYGIEAIRMVFVHSCML